MAPFQKTPSFKDPLFRFWPDLSQIIGCWGDHATMQSIREGQKYKIYEKRMWPEKGKHRGARDKAGLQQVRIQMYLR